MTSLQRVFKITPAWKDEGGRFGQHSAHMIFLVKGPAGTIEANFDTRWYIGEQRRFLAEDKKISAPWLWDVMAHKIAGIEDAHENESALNQDCQFIPEGETCIVPATWKDDLWLQGLVEAGSDWLWSKMEDWYRELFEEGPKVALVWTPVLIDGHGRKFDSHSEGWDK